MMEKMKVYWMYVLVAVVALLVGFGVSSLWNKPSNDAPADETQMVADKKTDTLPPLPSSVTSSTPTMPATGASATLGGAFQTPDQSAGSSVQVSGVTLNAPAWLVVYEDRAGIPGNVLGALWLPSGATPTARIELLRATNPGAVYYVMAQEDAGADRKFDRIKDLPFKDSSGAFIMMKFKTTGAQ